MHFRPSRPHNILSCGISLMLGGCYLSHPGEAREPADSNVGLDAGDGADGPGPTDADGLDAPSPDASALDGGGLDATPADGGGGDAPPIDGPPIDAARSDAGRFDAQFPDTGPISPALRFGPSLFLSIGDDPGFDLVSSSTLELWVRSREIRNLDICSKGDPTAQDMVVGQRDGRWVMGWQVGATSNLLEGPEVELNTWTHLALVREAIAGTETHVASFYVNGSLVVLAAGLTMLREAINDLPFICGFVDADIDEMRLWQAALEGETIAERYETRVSTGLPSLEGYWRLDEFGSQLALDRAGGGVHTGILGRFTTPDDADPLWIVDGAL